MTTVYGDLVRYRELFGNLFRRDLQAKYRGSVLGVAWTLANPFCSWPSIYSSSPCSGDASPLRALLRSSCSSGLRLDLLRHVAPVRVAVLLDNANLIRKMRFPRQLVPLSVVATKLVGFAVMLLVLLVLNLALLPRVRATEWLALPIAVAVRRDHRWAGARVASLNVLFRDIEFLVAALLLPLFFLTPCFIRSTDPGGSRAGSGSST